MANEQNEQAVEEIVAVGAGHQATMEFFKKTVNIFRSLADKPYHHAEITKFAAALIELERISGRSLADIGADKEALEKMVTDAFHQTLYHLRGTAVSRQPGERGMDADLVKNIIAQLEKDAVATLRLFS